MLPVNLPKKRNLMKDRVGMPRTSTYNLPSDPNYVYGRPNNRNDEGSGDIISNWVAADPSAGKESKRSYVHSNILATKHGCVTAQSMRMYAMAHPNIRLKEEPKADEEGGQVKKKGNHEGPFGVTTKYADESFAEIVQAKYTNYATDDADYPDTSNIMKLSSFPKPIPTKSSLVLESSKALKKEQEGKPPHKFIMKKFRNIPSKLGSPSRSPMNKTNSAVM